MFEIPPHLRAVVLLVAGLLAWPDELPWSGEVAARAADAPTSIRSGWRRPSLKAGSPLRVGICRTSQAIDDPDEDDANDGGLSASRSAAPNRRPTHAVEAPIRLPTFRAGCDLSRLCRFRC